MLCLLARSGVSHRYLARARPLPHVRRAAGMSAGLPPVKRAKTQSPTNTMPLTIGTHNGSFHCDEALACYLLQKLPRYADAKIVRTRDAETLAGCDIVVRACALVVVSAGACSEQ